MNKFLILRILVTSMCLEPAQTVCQESVLQVLPFIVEYALWRGWSQTIIFTAGIEHGCEWAIIRLMKCLSANGVASAVNTNSTYKIHLESNIGIMIFIPKLQRNNSNEILSDILKKIIYMELNTEPFDWLLVPHSENDFHKINKVLNSTELRFDQNIIVGFPINKNKNQTKMDSAIHICENNFDKTIIKKKSNKMHREIFIKNSERIYSSYYEGSDRENILNENFYYRTSERFKNLTKDKNYNSSGVMLPIYKSGIVLYNYSKCFEMTNISKFSLITSYLIWKKINNVQLQYDSVHIVQYFKVRANSTLYGHYLGVWSQGTSMSYVEIPYPVEARLFEAEELIIGRRNSSISIDGPVDEYTTPNYVMDHVLGFLTSRLNATAHVRYYSKIGLRTYEGVWTGLLGALADRSVDIALEPATAIASRYHDMDFVFPIAKTMSNIYIRHQETSSVRDIFLAPFSAKLLACVLVVAISAAAAVALISRAAPRQERSMGYIEALIWATSILCQQGGTWTPSSASASILMIVCLLFAVITYNAYAAFITSVLSVRVASVDTVSAVLHLSNFKIGYIKNGADQQYLMSTKDIQLNAFYIRGYSAAENLVSSAEEGLARAASQDYAFFTDQRVARTTLRSLSQARGRCALRELPVYSTKAYLAFPLTKDSSYKKPILLSLLQLRSSGALSRLERALVPSMPQCASPSGFTSARAIDVRSALLLLVLGLIAAACLGIAEYCWSNRSKMKKYLVRYYRKTKNLLK